MKHTLVSHTFTETPTPPLLAMTWPIPVASVLWCHLCVAGEMSALTNTATRICPKLAFDIRKYESPEIVKINVSLIWAISRRNVEMGNTYRWFRRRTRASPVRSL